MMECSRVVCGRSETGNIVDDTKIGERIDDLNRLMLVLLVVDDGRGGAHTWTVRL